MYLDHRTFFSATGICCQHQGSPLPSHWMLPFLLVLFLCLSFSRLLFLCCRLFLLELPFHTSECVMGYVRLGWFRSQEELRLTSGMRKSSSPLSTLDLSNFNSSVTPRYCSCRSFSVFFNCRHLSSAVVSLSPALVSPTMLSVFSFFTSASSTSSRCVSEFGERVGG